MEKRYKRNRKNAYREIGMAFIMVFISLSVGDSNVITKLIGWYSLLIINSTIALTYIISAVFKLTKEFCTIKKKSITFFINIIKTINIQFKDITEVKIKGENDLSISVKSGKTHYLSLNQLENQFEQQEILDLLNKHAKKNED